MLTSAAPRWMRSGGWTVAPAEVLGIVRALLDIVLSLVPSNQAASLLNEQAVKRQNAVADAAALAKFGPK